MTNMKKDSDRFPVKLMFTMLDKWEYEGSLQQKIDKAVDAIITYETLPSQIDYRAPQKNKAEEGYKLLNTIPIGIRTKYFDKIEAEIDEYNTPVQGMDKSPAELNEMF